MSFEVRHVCDGFGAVLIHIGRRATRKVGAHVNSKESRRVRTFSSNQQMISVCLVQELRHLAPHWEKGTESGRQSPSYGRHSLLRVQFACRRRNAGTFK